MKSLHPSGPVRGDVRVPGSKYVANRILLMAALAKGKSTIHNVPLNDDIQHLLNAIQQLGVDVDVEGSTVTLSRSGSLVSPSDPIDVGHSGTLLRFITACASLVDGETTITGSDRIKERPLSPLVDSLHEVGVHSSSTKGCVPVTIQGGNLQGGNTTISGDISSQFLSALLLIAPYAKQEMTISLSSELVSKKYVDLTIALMNTFGVKVEREQYESFTVPAGQQYQNREYTIPSDISSANYFFAAAAITKGKVTVSDFDDTDYGESYFLDCLERMGCAVSKEQGSITVQGNDLTGIDVNMSDAPDAVQALAVVAAHAQGTTTITSIGHLVHKESDRITDTVTELRTVGVNITSTADSLTIESSEVHKGTIDPRQDHRLAMSCALVGLTTKDVWIDKPETVNKSFPTFWDTWKKLGVNVDEQ